MTRPKHTKKDANHAQVRDESREVGIVVWDLADLPTPVLDQLHFWRGQVRVVEVKPKGKGDVFERAERGEVTLTKSEQAEWKSILALRAVGVDVTIATCTEDVIADFLKDERKEAEDGKV